MKKKPAIILINSILIIIASLSVYSSLNTNKKLPTTNPSNSVSPNPTTISVTDSTEQTPTPPPDIHLQNKIALSENSLHKASRIFAPMLDIGQKSTVSDFAFGDVNGDKVEDTVILVTKKDNIITNRIIVQDGKTLVYRSVPSQITADLQTEYSSMILGDFNGDGIKDISARCGSAGADGARSGTFLIFTYKNYIPKIIFNNSIGEKFPKFTITFKNNYKVELRNDAYNYVRSIDIKNVLPSDNIIYSDKGKLLESRKEEVFGFCSVDPVYFDNDDWLEVNCASSVFGSASGDFIGFINVIMKYSSYNNKWDMKRIYFEPDSSPSINKPSSSSTINASNKKALAIKDLFIDATIKIPSINIGKIIKIENYETGDVNGDKVDDMVLWLSSGNYEPYENRMVIQDGKTFAYKLIDPALTYIVSVTPRSNFRLGDFNNDNIYEILISCDTGGNGGAGTHSFVMFSYKNNKTKIIFNDSVGENMPKFEAVFKNNFKFEISNNSLNYRQNISIRNRTDAGKSIYSISGILLKKISGNVENIFSIEPVYKSGDKSLQIKCGRYVSGIERVDGIGELWTIMKYDSNKWNVTGVYFEPYLAQGSY